MPERTARSWPANWPWFGISMVIVLATVGLITGTHSAPLAENVREWTGFGAGHLWSLAWHRAFLSVFFTAGGASFWASIVMLALCVTALELRAGTTAAALAFWLAHLATLLVISLLVAFPLHAMGSALGRSFVIENAVGPSAGYYGCLGTFVATMRRPPSRWGAAVIILLILVARCGLSLGDLGTQDAPFHAALAHLVALPIGLLLAGPLLAPRMPKAAR